MDNRGAAGSSVEEEAEESFKRYIQPVRRSLLRIVATSSVEDTKKNTPKDHHRTPPRALRIRRFGARAGQYVVQDDPSDALESAQGRRRRGRRRYARARLPHEVE